MNRFLDYPGTCECRPVKKIVERPRQPKIDDKAKLTGIGIELARIRATQAKLAETLEQVIDHAEMLPNGKFKIPSDADLSHFNSTEVQHPTAQTFPHREANDQMSSETPTARSDGLACKIRLNLQGMLHKKPNFWREPFAAISPVNPICVFQEAHASGVRRWLCCYDAESRNVLVNQGFSRMTFRTFITKEGQLNVQWMSEGYTYYINFADWSIHPGEILRNVLQTCGALWVPDPLDGILRADEGRHYSPSSTSAPETLSGASRIPKRRPTRMRADSPESSPLFSVTTAHPGNQKPAFGRWLTRTAPFVTPPSTKTTFSSSPPAPAVPTVAPNPRSVSGSVEKGARKDECAKVERIAEFKPVTALASLAETETDEDVMFYEKAKLYRFDSDTHQWKESGLGEMKILRNQTTGKYRVFMRHDQICASHPIIPGLKLLPRTKPNEYTWVAPDSADGEQKQKYFVIRFRSEEQAKKFKEIFDEGLTAAERTTPIEPEAAKAEAPSPNPEPEPSGSSSCSDKKNDAATRTARAGPNPAEATQACDEASPDAANKPSPFKFVVEAAFKEMKNSTSLFKKNPDPYNCPESVRPIPSSYTEQLAHASCYVNSDTSQVSRTQ